MEGEPLQYPDIEGILDKYLDLCVVGCLGFFFLQGYLGVCMVIQQQ